MCLLYVVDFHSTWMQAIIDRELFLVVCTICYIWKGFNVYIETDCFSSLIRFFFIEYVCTCQTVSDCEKKCCCEDCIGNSNSLAE